MICSEQKEDYLNIPVHNVIHSQSVTYSLQLSDSNGHCCPRSPSSSTSPLPKLSFTPPNMVMGLMNNTFHYGSKTRLKWFCHGRMEGINQLPQLIKEGAGATSCMDVLKWYCFFIEPLQVKVRFIPRPNTFYFSVTVLTFITHTAV